MNYLKNFQMKFGGNIRDIVPCLVSKSGLANDDGPVDILGVHAFGVSPEGVDANLVILREEDINLVRGIVFFGLVDDKVFSLSRSISTVFRILYSFVMSSSETTIVESLFEVPLIEKQNSSKYK